MKKIILASLAALSLVSPLQSQAQEANLLGIKGLSANVGAVTDYRFRGISQTFNHYAVQGGIDYTHSSGLYVGNWNSSINEGAGYPSAHWETDFYAGYKKSFGDFGLDVGAIYYDYPGSNSIDDPTQSGRLVYNPTTGKKAYGPINNTEFYIGGTWKMFSAKWFRAMDDYFSVPNTKGTQYLDLSTNVELSDGWAWNAHIGMLKTKNINSSTLNADYMDYKLGVTKDVSGFVLGATAIWTSANAGTCNSANFGTKSGPYCYTDNLSYTAGNAKNVINAGRSTVVFSVTKGF